MALQGTVRRLTRHKVQELLGQSKYTSLRGFLPQGIRKPWTWRLPTLHDHSSYITQACLTPSEPVTPHGKTRVVLCEQNCPRPPPGLLALSRKEIHLMAGALTDYKLLGLADLFHFGVLRTKSLKFRWFRLEVSDGDYKRRRDCNHGTRCEVCSLNFTGFSCPASLTLCSQIVKSGFPACPNSHKSCCNDDGHGGSLV